MNQFDIIGNEHHMWITGFDVPCLDTMYCYKPLQMHTLIQTVSRVNRNYPGKGKGLIVDYLGIKKKFNQAMKNFEQAENFKKNRSISETEAESPVLKKSAGKKAQQIQMIPKGSMLENVEADEDVRRFVHNMMELYEGTTIDKIYVECQKEYQEHNHTNAIGTILLLA